MTLTLGLFALTQMEFDLNVVAALLTLIGYSLNDTIVIYDRIRENLRKYRKMDMVPLLNLSMNETLARTVATNFAMLLALGSLMLLGPDVIQGFTTALLFSVVVGTYSTVYIAAPFLVWLKVTSDSFVPEDDARSPAPSACEPQRRLLAMPRWDRDAQAAGPLVQGFSGRGFIVDGGVYEGLLLTPERAEGWDAPPLAELTADDLAPLLALDPPPEFILLGTGPAMAFPPRALDEGARGARHRHRGDGQPRRRPHLGRASRRGALDRRRFDAALTQSASVAFCPSCAGPIR